MNWGSGALIMQDCDRCKVCWGSGERSCNPNQCWGDRCKCGGTGRRPCENCKATGRRNCKKCKGEGCPSWTYRTAPFREAFEKSGMTPGQLEEICGWKYKGYANRVLGYRHSQSGHRNGGRIYLSGETKTLSYENAVKIAKALDLDLVEWCI